MAETNTSSDSVVDDPTHPYHSTAAVYGRKHFTITEPSATQLASISLRSNHKVDLADRVKFRRLYPSKQAVLDNWSLDRINGEILQRSIRIPRPRTGEPKNSSSVATSGKRLLAHYDYLAEQLHWQEFYRRKQASASRDSDRDARPPERGGGSPASSAESRSPSDEDRSHSEEEDSSQSEEDDSVSEEQTDPEEGSAHEPSDYEDGSAHEPSDYEEDSESSASGGTHQAAGPRTPPPASRRSAASTGSNDHAPRHRSHRSSHRGSSRSRSQAQGKTSPRFRSRSQSEKKQHSCGHRLRHERSTRSSTSTSTSSDSAGGRGQNRPTHQGAGAQSFSAASRSGGSTSPSSPRRPWRPGSSSWSSPPVQGHIRRRSKSSQRKEPRPRPRTSQQQQHRAPYLPDSLRVTERLLRRIRRGEFINFNDLLQENLYPSPAPSTTQQAIQVQRAEGGGLELAVRQQGRRKVSDLSSWLEAYFRYLAAVTADTPYRLGKMLAYADMIRGFAVSYHPQQWLAYDGQFRSEAARNPSKRWDRIDNQIWATHVATPFCGRCLQRGHRSTDCVRRPNGNPGPTLGTPRAPRGKHATTAAGQNICFKYNAGACRGRCRFAHVCHQCLGGHPAYQCRSPSTPARTTATAWGAAPPSRPP